MDSQKGGQTIKSLLGVFVFIVFIMVSVFFNGPIAPLSYNIAFGQNSGGSGSGGGGGGGGGVSVSAGTGGTANATVNSFSIFEVGEAFVSFSWSVTNANLIKLYAGEGIESPKEVASFTTENSYKLQNLKKNTNHSFYLETRSSAGNVTKTGILTVKTGIPIATPQTVVATQPVTDRTSLIASLRQQLTGLLASVLDLLQKQVANRKVLVEAPKPVEPPLQVVEVPTPKLEPAPASAAVETLKQQLVNTAAKVIDLLTEQINNLRGKKSPPSVTVAPAPVAPDTSAVKQQLVNLIGQAIDLQAKQVASLQSKAAPFVPASAPVVECVEPPYVELLPGNESDNVRQLQICLVKWKYANFEPNGYYGSRTSTAVTDLQRFLTGEARGPRALELKTLMTITSKTGDWVRTTYEAEKEYLAWLKRSGY